MRIRFMGLISHLEDGGNHFAAAVRAPKHTPKLRVRKGDIVGNDDGDTTVECRVISGRTVTFSLGMGAATRTGLRLVPNLMRLGGAGGSLHSAVRARNATNPANDYECFVDLPEGTYGVEDYFKDQAQFGHEPMACLPRTVIYDTTNTGPVTIFNAGPDIQLKAGAVITITHIEPQNTPAAAHFQRYGRLFDPPVTIAGPTQGPVCGDGSDESAIPRCPGEPFLSFTVECSNSQYP